MGEYLISLTGGYTSTNYQFVLQTGTITVVKKDVTAVATAVSRPYEHANTNVTVNFGSISGIVNNDDVSLSYTSTTGTIDSPNVGLRNVTFTPPTLVGSKAKNYNLIINTNIVVEIVKANPTGVVFPSQATVEYGLPLSAAQFKNDFEIPKLFPATSFETTRSSRRNRLRQKLHGSLRSRRFCNPTPSPSLLWL